MPLSHIAASAGSLQHIKHGRLCMRTRLPVIPGEPRGLLNVAFLGQFDQRSGNSSGIKDGHCSPSAFELTAGPGRPGQNPARCQEVLQLRCARMQGGKLAEPDPLVQIVGLLLPPGLQQNLFP